MKSGSNPLRFHLDLVYIFKITLFVSLDAFADRYSKRLGLVLKVLIVGSLMATCVAHFCYLSLLVHQNHFFEHSLLLSLVESDYVLNLQFFVFLRLSHLQNFTLLRFR